MIELEMSKDLQENLCKNGLERSKLFSWDNAATKVWDEIYQCFK